MLIVALTFYFLIIVVISLANSPQIKSPILNLFKTMFPSWVFFDESIDTPVLLYRLKTDEQFDEWRICLLPPPFKWHQLLFNPQGNYYLAYHSHIQQLLGELTALDSDQLELFHHQVSYKTTENIVRFELSKRKITHGEFQFKISAIKLEERDSFSIIEDILLSPTLAIQSGNPL